jgi:oligopeptide transport system substrate-binding protein
LKAQGIEVSKENPIILDAPVLDTSTINIAAASMENSLEKA